MIFMYTRTPKIDRRLPSVCCTDSRERVWHSSHECCMLVHRAIAFTNRRIKCVGDESDEVSSFLGSGFSRLRLVCTINCIVRCALDQRYLKGTSQGGAQLGTVVQGSRHLIRHWDFSIVGGLFPPSYFGEALYGRPGKTYNPESSVSCSVCAASSL